MKPWEEAYDDWLGGMKYREIAEKHGVTESTVKSWATRYFKAKKEEDATKKVATKGQKKLQPSSEKLQPKKNRGAPFGNQNAKGNHGGAPPGNSNALKHGAFSKKYFTELDPNDAAWVEDVPSDEEELLQFQLRDLLLKARYLERKIKEADAPGLGLAVDSLVREDGPHGKRSATAMRPLYERYLKLTAELDKTHGRITSITKALMQYREGRERLELERKRLALMEQKLLLESDQDGSNGAEMNLNIYLPDNGRDKDA